MDPPLAYFITWSCYGTWLPGDWRLSVDKKHNALGTPKLNPDAKRVRAAQARLKGVPMVLSPEARPIVERTIRDHCAVRGWRLHAVNVRSNHVHTVVTAEGVSPEIVMNQFKSWATRRLREHGIVKQGERVWTKHGSTRWLNAQKYVDLAIEYVRDRQ